MEKQINNQPTDKALEREMTRVRGQLLALTSLVQKIDIAFSVGGLVGSPEFANQIKMLKSTGATILLQIQTTSQKALVRELELIIQTKLTDPNLATELDLNHLPKAQSCISNYLESMDPQRAEKFNARIAWLKPILGLEKTDAITHENTDLILRSNPISQYLARYNRREKTNLIGIRCRQISTLLQHKLIPEEEKMIHKILDVILAHLKVLKEEEQIEREADAIAKQSGKGIFFTANSTSDKDEAPEQNKEGAKQDNRPPAEEMIKTMEQHMEGNIIGHLRQALVLVAQIEYWYPDVYKTQKLHQKKDELIHKIADREQLDNTILGLIDTINKKIQENTVQSLHYALSLLQEIENNYMHYLNGKHKDYLFNSKLTIGESLAAEISHIKGSVEKKIIWDDAASLSSAQKGLADLYNKYKGTGLIEDEWFATQQKNIQEAIDKLLSTTHKDANTNKSANAPVEKVDPKDLDPRTGRRKDYLFGI